MGEEGKQYFIVNGILLRIIPEEGDLSKKGVSY
jgi:hypothetical protein